MSLVVPEGVGWNVPLQSTQGAADLNPSGHRSSPATSDPVLEPAPVVVSVMAASSLSFLAESRADVNPAAGNGVGIDTSAAEHVTACSITTSITASPYSAQREVHSYPSTAKPFLMGPPTPSCSYAPSLAGRACYFFLGAGMLAAWNSLITATDYFGAVYPGWHTDRLFTVSYLPVCLVMLVVGIRYPDLPPQPCRIRLGYGGFTAAMAAVPLIDALFLAPSGGSGNGAAPATTADSTAAPGAGLVAVLVCVVLVGACDGLCQGALFAEAAQLAPPYTQAVVTGTASSGLMVCMLRIASKASFEAGADSAEDRARGLRHGTQLYFTLAGLMSLTCWIVYDLVLPRLRTLPARGPVQSPGKSSALPPPHWDFHEVAVGNTVDALGSTSPGDRDHNHDYMYERHPLLASLPLELSNECRSRGGSGGEGTRRENTGKLATTIAADGPYSTSVQGLDLPTRCGADVGDMPAAPNVSFLSSFDTGGHVDVRGSSGSSGNGGHVHVCAHNGRMYGSSPHEGLVNVETVNAHGDHEDHGGGVRQQIRRCLALSWPLCGSLFVTYTVTLSIFPGFLAEDVHSAQLGDWYPILLITAFNLADLVGKSLPVLEPLEPLEPLGALPQPTPTSSAMSLTAPDVDPKQTPERPHPDLRQPQPQPQAQQKRSSWSGNHLRDDYEGNRDLQNQQDNSELQQMPLLRSHSWGGRLSRCSNHGGSGGDSAGCSRRGVVRCRFSCRALAVAALRPLRQPRGLLVTALLRGVVALPAFLGAARWRAPAGVMAALTAALGVSNGYLTTQILTMGPTTVVTPCTTSPSSPPPWPLPTVTATATTTLGRSPPVISSNGHSSSSPQDSTPAQLPVSSSGRAGAAGLGAAFTSTRYQALPEAEPIECNGGRVATSTALIRNGGGLPLRRCSAIETAPVWDLIQGQGQGQGRQQGQEKGLVAPTQHSDAEVIEALLVIGLVAGLNAGAYLGWLWLLSAGR